MQGPPHQLVMSHPSLPCWLGSKVRGNRAPSAPLHCGCQVVTDLTELPVTSKKERLTEATRTPEEFESFSRSPNSLRPVPCRTLRGSISPRLQDCRSSHNTAGQLSGQCLSQAPPQPPGASVALEWHCHSH